MARVSINLCCYNSERYLEQTLQSVVGQTYRDWELVIVNDGSSDSTESIAAGYMKKGYPIVYHYQENQGLSASRNKALALSGGQYIAFIDHDDIWMPDKLQVQMALVDQDPEPPGLVYSKAVCFTESGRSYEPVTKYLGRDLPEGRILDQLLLDDCFITLSSAIALREACLQAGGFPKRFRYAEDYYMFAAIAARHKARCAQRTLCKYRLHDSNTTHRVKTEGCREKLEIFSKWSPFLGEEISEKKKLAKMKRHHTMIGSMMIKYDRQYMKGFQYIWARGSFFMLFDEFIRYASARSDHAQQ